MKIGMEFQYLEMIEKYLSFKWGILGESFEPVVDDTAIIISRNELVTVTDNIIWVFTDHKV